MTKKITFFLLHHKKNASNHLFSKQLKNLQSNLLIGGFISIIYSSQAVKTLRLQLFIHYLLSQASGLSLAVSLRSWNWRMFSEPTLPKA
jgi:hypothetical protein